MSKSSSSHWTIRPLATPTIVEKSASLTFEPSGYRHYHLPESESSGVVSQLGSTGEWLDTTDLTEQQVAIFGTIQNVRDQLDDWDELDGPAPRAEILTFAESVVALLPAEMRHPKLGIGSDGDVYFSWENERGVSFLTIDDEHVHVLVKLSGEKPQYNDDMPRDYSVLSNKVLPSVRTLPPGSGANSSTSNSE